MSPSSAVRQVISPLLCTIALTAIAVKGFHWPPILSWATAVNVTTGWLFWSDKARASQGRWRVPENALLFLSFLGGWPSGLLVSQAIRHKTSKGSFRLKFWGVVLLQILITGGIMGWLQKQDFAANTSPPREIQISFPKRAVPTPWPNHTY